MATDFSKCLTEIRCRRIDSYGTGYLIAPDLILTACHVVAKPLDQPPRDSGIEIRTIAHFEKGIPFQNAELVWPSSERWRELSRLDIALLKIAPDTITREVAWPVTLGTEGLSQTREIGVHFAGFPRLMTIEGTENRDTKQVFGEVDLLSGIKQELLEVTFKRPPRKDRDWRGASGAAVFADERMMGVLIVKVVDDLVDFRASRLDAALSDPDFRSRVETSAARTTSPAIVESELNLGRLVCLVNRDPQETSFRTTFRKLLTGEAPPPLCCLIYGGAAHRPDELMQRFASVTIPELRKLRPGETLTFWPINWPGDSGDVAANLATLRGLLWNTLSDQDGSMPPSDFAEFRDRLCDESRPHLFATDLSAAHLTDEGAALLTAWLSFLDSVAACERKLTRAPLHVFLISDVNRSQIETWLKNIPPAKTTLRQPLDELAACRWLDFQDWIGTRVPKVVPAFAAAAAALKDDLEAALEEKVGGPREFSLSDLKHAVRKVKQRK